MVLGEKMLNVNKTMLTIKTTVGLEIQVHRSGWKEFKRFCWFLLRKKACVEQD